MKLLNRSALKLFVVAVLCGSCAAALAMPKAAEHEDAQVTSGFDAARPKRSAVAAKPPATTSAKPAGAVKSRPAGATAKTTTQGKTAKSGKTAKPGKAVKGSKKTAKPGAHGARGKAGKSAKTATHTTHPAARPANMARTTHR